MTRWLELREVMVGSAYDPAALGVQVAGNLAECSRCFAEEQPRRSCTCGLLSSPANISAGSQKPVKGQQGKYHKKVVPMLEQKAVMTSSSSDLRIRTQCARCESVFGIRGTGTGHLHHRMPGLRGGCTRREKTCGAVEMNVFGTDQQERA